MISLKVAGIRHYFKETHLALFWSEIYLSKKKAGWSRDKRKASTATETSFALLE